MTTTPRYRIAMQVLEAAEDAGDPAIVAACRRVITADRLGWRKYGSAEDLRRLYEFDAE